MNAQSSKPVQCGVIPLQMLLATPLGWLDREQRDVIAFLREENRVLKAQLGRCRLRLDDEQRRRLTMLGQRHGRGLLREVATLVTPDTVLRWHRELVAKKWTYALVVRMATDNPLWGYRRIQGALKNVGHSVARSTMIWCASATCDAQCDGRASRRLIRGAQLVAGDL
jgi:putative transposase